MGEMPVRHFVSRAFLVVYDGSVFQWSNVLCIVETI